MPARRKRRSHWWITGGAVVATVATTLGGVIPVLNYFHDQDTAELQQKSDRAAKNAVLDYRLQRDEDEINRLRDRKECTP